MPINILGMIGVTPPAGGATVHVIGGGIDRDYVCRFAHVHEAAGFDAVLVGYSSSSAEGFQIAQYAAAEFLQHALALAEALVGPYHWRITNGRNTLAAVYTAQAR